MKKFLVITIILLGLAGATILIIANIDDQKNGVVEPQVEVNIEEKVDYASEYVNKLTEIIIYGDPDDELYEYLQTDYISLATIMSGDGVYLLQNYGLDETDSNLTEYFEKASKMNDAVQEKIVENFEYEILGVADGIDYVSVLVQYKTFNYSDYLIDLIYIENKILELIGFDLEKTDYTEEDLINIYKAKVKASVILFDYLDNYNNNETKTIYVQFNDFEAEQSSDSFISYLYNLNGNTYSSQNINYDDIDSLLSTIDVDELLDL